MNKFTMELIWHSCTTCLPEEGYNPCLYVTDGNSVFGTTWKRDPNWQRFEHGKWYIEPGINSDGYWWADIEDTVRKTKQFEARI